MTVAAAESAPAPTATEAAPSAPDAAPAPAAAPAEPGPAPKSLTPAQRFQRAAAMLTGQKPPPAAAPAPALSGVGDKPADAAPADGDATESDAAPAETAPAADATKVPEQRLGETDEKFAARLAKAIGDLTAKDAALLQRENELKSERAAREAKEKALADMTAKLEAISKDPLAALKAAGTSFDELTKMVLEGKIKAPTAEDEIRSKLDEKSKSIEDKLAELQAKLEAKEKAEAEAAEKAKVEQTRANDLKVVQSLLPAEKFPIVAALGAHESVLDICYRDGSQDVAGKAAEWEKDIISRLELVLEPKTLAALEARSPKIRETVKTLKGASDQSRKNPVSREGPRVLAADTVSAPTTPIDRPQTQQERLKRALTKLYSAGG